MNISQDLDIISKIKPMTTPNPSFRVARDTFSIAQLEDESDEKAFWWSKSPQERWQAIEIMRQISMAIVPQIPQDFKEFLQLLNIYQVEYLLIGGYAVGY